MQKINNRHQQAHECHRSRWKQCRVDRSRRDLREEYPSRAYRSPSPERFPPKASYYFKYRSPHEVEYVTERFYVQVGSSSCKCLARTLQAGHPKRHSHSSHQEAHKHGAQGANRSSPNAEYGASFIARPNEAFVNPRKLDVYQLRQSYYWRST